MDMRFGILPSLTRQAQARQAQITFDSNIYTQLHTTAMGGRADTLLPIAQIRISLGSNAGGAPGITEKTRLQALCTFCNCLE